MSHVNINILTWRLLLFMGELGIQVANRGGISGFVVDKNIVNYILEKVNHKCTGVFVYVFKTCNNL